MRPKGKIPLEVLVVTVLVFFTILSSEKSSASTCRIGAVSYDSIQDAYDSAQDRDIIRCRNITFTEKIIFNRNITFTMDGGYDAGFTTNSGGKTTVKGTINLISGKLFISNFILEKSNIVFTHVPPYGSDEPLEGKVFGVNPSEYKVACYINIEEVWWTKPYFSAPLVPINPDGTWSCDITTGGHDQFACQIEAFLVPNGASPPICGPCCITPSIERAVASAVIDRCPTRTISFAGYSWTVKRRDFPAGPGGNYFSDKQEHAFVDTDGMHLTISRQDGKWYSSEVILNQTLGYGTYKFETHSRVDRLDANQVLGLFTWETAACEENYKELDIEFSRWGKPLEPTNAQFVVQPCSACPGCANCSRFTVDLEGKDAHLTNYIVWQPGSVEFRSYYGRYPTGVPPQSALAHKWTKTDSGVPDARNEKARINFWLVGGAAPTDNLDREVLISDFAWQAGVPDWQEKPGIFIDGVSPYGTADGWVWGHVTGVDYAEHAVAVYIQVRGGWWTKPYWDTPQTPINPDVSWRCDITTGGVDPEATRVVAYLIPKSYNPPLASGQPTLPIELESNSLAKAEIMR